MQHLWPICCISGQGKTSLSSRVLNENFREVSPAGPLIAGATCVRVYKPFAGLLAAAEHFCMEGCGGVGGGVLGGGER